MAQVFKSGDRYYHDLLGWIYATPCGVYCIGCKTKVASTKAWRVHYNASHRGDFNGNFQHVPEKLEAAIEEAKKEFEGSEYDVDGKYTDSDKEEKRIYCTNCWTVFSDKRFFNNHLTANAQSWHNVDKRTHGKRGPC